MKNRRGQIVHQIIFGQAHSALQKKKKKTLDLQNFSRIGKTRKKLH